MVKWISSKNRRIGRLVHVSRVSRRSYRSECVSTSNGSIDQSGMFSYLFSFLLSFTSRSSNSELPVTPPPLAAYRHAVPPTSCPPAQPACLLNHRSPPPCHRHRPQEILHRTAGNAITTRLSPPPLGLQPLPTFPLRLLGHKAHTAHLKIYIPNPKPLHPTVDFNLRSRLTTTLPLRRSAHLPRQPPPPPPSFSNRTATLLRR